MAGWRLKKPMSASETFQNEFRFVFFTPPGKYDETVAFYRDVMQFRLNGGFGERPEQMRGTYVQAANAVLEIISDPEESPFMGRVLERGQAFRAAQGGYILIEVENVDEIYRRLLESGVHLHRTIADWPWGFRDFMIQDPCGNVLCLFSRRSQG
jgi:predicted enzyme related to lactoylglutathione lyase